MFCTNCGNQITESNKYCSACGHKILEQSIDGKETFVKRGKREMDDLADIVSSSKVVENIASSKDSISYVKKQSENLFYKFLEVLGVMGIAILVLQVFRGFTGYWIITESYRETIDFEDNLIRLLVPIIIPLILVYFGLRHKKGDMVGISWGGFLFLTWIVLLILFTIVFENQ